MLSVTDGCQRSSGDSVRMEPRRPRSLYRFAHSSKIHKLGPPNQTRPSRAQRASAFQMEKPPVLALGRNDIASADTKRPQSGAGGTGATLHGDQATWLMPSWPASLVRRRMAQLCSGCPTLE